MLRVLDQRIVEKRLSEEEVKGIATNLTENYPHVFCAKVNGKALTTTDARRLLRVKWLKGVK